MDLRNKAVMITGAASGIGRATTFAFAREGAEPLILVDIDSDGLAVTSARMEKDGARTLTFTADVSDFSAVKGVVSQVLNDVGRIDVLINCAGIAVFSPFEELGLSDWKMVLGVNLWGTIYTVQLVYPHMLEKRCGHIVNVSSANGLLYWGPYLAGYGTSKFGIVGLSEALMLEASVNGIGVTCVCPGAVDTPIWDVNPIKGFRPDIREHAKRLFLFGETADQTASSIVRAVKKNRFLVVTTPAIKFLYFIKRHLPLLWYPLSRLNARIAAKLGEGYRL